MTDRSNGDVLMSEQEAIEVLRRAPSLDEEDAVRSSFEGPLIDRYLESALDPVQEARFEAQLESDSQLAEQLETAWEARLAERGLAVRPARSRAACLSSETLAAYADGSLSPAERALVEAHGACANCGAPPSSFEKVATPLDRRRTGDPDAAAPGSVFVRRVRRSAGHPNVWAAAAAVLLVVAIGPTLLEDRGPERIARGDAELADRVGVRLFAEIDGRKVWLTSGTVVSSPFAFGIDYTNRVADRAVYLGAWLRDAGGERIWLLSGPDDAPFALGPNGAADARLEDLFEIDVSPGRLRVTWVLSSRPLRLNRPDPTNAPNRLTADDVPNDLEPGDAIFAVERLDLTVSAP